MTGLFERDFESPDYKAGRLGLAERLDEVLSLPGAPTGATEAILAMSLPPAFTACPNPFLEDWLKATTPSDYESLPYEDPGPFAGDISQGKGHALYKAHSFHTKVPHQAIMQYVLHYTKPGDVVLDGFAGSGMTGVAAQACGVPERAARSAIETAMGNVKWGSRRAILQDLSPVATFIGAGVNLPIDSQTFDRRSKELLDEFDAEFGWMYKTLHKDGERGNIEYTIWSEVMTCPHCGGEVEFYKAAFEHKTGRVRDSFRCPACGAQVDKDSLARRRVPIRTLAGDTTERVEFRPVRIHYRYGRATFDKEPDEEDFEVLRKIGRLNVSGFPTNALPLGEMGHGSRLGPKGFTHLHHLWSDRSLVALSALWTKCAAESDPLLRLALLFWLEQALWGLSWMNRYKANDHSQVNRQLTGVYYVPSLVSECSVRYNLGGSEPNRGKRAALAKTWSASPARNGQVMISTGSSTHLPLPDSCIDYVFVDPPFGANIPYADLDLVIESWHRVFTAVPEEAVLDKLRVKDLVAYQGLMERCFREFQRVLKPGRWMTVEFSNSSNEVWLAIQESLSSAGFVVADTRVFDKEQLSYRQITAKNAVKRDLIISAYKPADELEERFALAAGSEDGAWAFVREHLAHIPVFEGRRGEGRMVRERQADRLYDRMVAYHVHRGTAVPLTAGEFYSGLEQRFPVRDDMYFLPEQVESYERHRLTVKELLQAELFITSEASAVQWLRQLLKSKPRIFAEIQPPFLSELQAGLPDWEALPDLKQILDENFLQDSENRWYVPDPKKASDLEQLRAKALLKEFNRYIEAKGKLDRFRSEAVRAGFKEAWANRDFHMIVSVGSRLPADALAEDEALFYYLDNARRLAK